MNVFSFVFFLVCRIVIVDSCKPVQVKDIDAVGSDVLWEDCIKMMKRAWFLWEQTNEVDYLYNLFIFLYCIVRGTRGDSLINVKNLHFKFSKGDENGSCETARMDRLDLVPAFWKNNRGRTGTKRIDIVDSTLTFYDCDYCKLGDLNLVGMFKLLQEHKPSDRLEANEPFYLSLINGVCKVCFVFYFGLFVLFFCFVCLFVCFVFLFCLFVLFVCLFLVRVMRFGFVLVLLVVRGRVMCCLRCVN